jgi:hypothetical protein
MGTSERGWRELLNDFTEYCLQQEGTTWDDIDTSYITKKMLELVEGVEKSIRRAGHNPSLDEALNSGDGTYKP